MNMNKLLKWVGVVVVVWTVLFTIIAVKAEEYGVPFEFHERDIGWCMHVDEADAMMDRSPFEIVFPLVNRFNEVQYFIWIEKKSNHHMIWAVVKSTKQACLIGQGNPQIETEKPRRSM